MDKTVRKLGYQLGDSLGDFAPDFLQPRSRFFVGSSALIGFGSILAAVGIGYLALRIADRRLGEVIQSLIPSYAATNGRKWPAVHRTSGAEMPDADRMEGSRMETSGVQGTEGSDWGMPE